MSNRPAYLLATGTVPDGLIEEAAKAGMTLDVLPFIRIEYLEDNIDREDLTAQPLTVVFTSVNAVNAVGSRLIQPLPQWRIYCISGATAAALVEIFGKNAIAGTAASAAELAIAIRAREREIIFFCGDQRREELPSLLREAGLQVTEKIVYRTLPTPHRLERSYDGIAFFSPSAVESFFSVNRPGVRVPLFAIGKTTRDAIRGACTNPEFTCKTPDKAAVIRQMIDFFLFKP